MNRYLTTTLPYVNASPHIGFALEVVQADAVVRAWRAQGDDVFFNTGTDEHGQKIFEAAKHSGEAVQAYADRYAEEFKKLAEALDLSVTRFIRTTDEGHLKAAQEMWKRCEKDIYKKAYTGRYCVGCESFKTEKEIVDGHCELHPNLTLEEITEENYFFKLSNYQDYLKKYLSNESSIIPEWRRKEALQFVEGGLEDFSISREKKRLSWGVPVPGDDDQVMYVWFDALTNYISTLGWPNEGGDFEKYWENGKVFQVAGKDQVRFQSIMWQAMLKSAGVKATDQVFYHGFINSGGQKMSKSLGNVINPYDLVKKYGTDATRYMLLRHVHPTEDSDVTWERLDEWYTANLVNGLGNLVARVMKLAETHLTEPAAIAAPRTVRAAAATPQNFAFNEALDAIWREIGVVDDNLTKQEPFKVVKVDPERGRELITRAVQHIAMIAHDLAPFMPATSKTILNAVATNTKPENLFPRLG